MARTRDSQRSAVYAWERAAVPGYYADKRNAPSLETIEPFVKRVWLAERGRYGLARYPVPALRGGSGSAWGETGSLKLPPFARASRAVIVHEIAHALDGSKGYGRGRGGAHGPRFVGIFIGLLAEVLMRTYFESQNKRAYVIKSVKRRGKSVETGRA